MCVCVCECVPAFRQRLLVKAYLIKYYRPFLHIFASIHRDIVVFISG